MNESAANVNVKDVQKRKFSGDHCCVVGCTHTRINAPPNTKFYGFSNVSYKREQREKWILAVRRVNPDGSPWQPSRRSKICSVHFIGNEKSDISRSPSYVPRIFPSQYRKIHGMDKSVNSTLKAKQQQSPDLVLLPELQPPETSGQPKDEFVAEHGATRERQPPETSGQPKDEFVAEHGATRESKHDVVDIKSEPLEPHALFIPETFSQPTVDFLPEHVSTITGKHDILEIKSEPLEPRIAFIPGTSSQPTIEFLPEHVPTITGQVTETSQKPATKKTISNKVNCRMCLEPVTKKQMVPLSLIDVNYPGKSENFKQSKAVKIEKVVSMILVVMPDFDFDVAYNPIICHKCSARLETAYNFVQTCRANEKLIHSYKAKFAPNEELISCDDVAQKKNLLTKETPPPKKPRNFKQLDYGITGDGNETDRNVAQKKDHLTKDMPPQKKLKTSNENVPSTIVRNFRQFAGPGDGIEGNVNSEIDRIQENIVVESAPESGLIKHEIEDLDYGNGAGTSNCMITAEELSSIVKEEDIVEEDIPLEPYDTSTDDWSISQAQVNAIVNKKEFVERDPDNYKDYQGNSNIGLDESDFSQSVGNSSKRTMTGESDSRNSKQ